VSPDFAEHRRILRGIRRGPRVRVVRRDSVHLSERRERADAAVELHHARRAGSAAAARRGLRRPYCG
jgi:hypothetical protein